MTGLTAILQKEVKNIFNSGWSIFFINAFIAVTWSVTMFCEHELVQFLLVFLAGILAANFSGTVFISERVSGTLEVLIVSGVTRDAVLFGKMLFVTGATMAMGAVCVVFSIIWAYLLSGVDNVSEWMTAGWVLSAAFLYVGATVFNVSASAYLSVRMGNPRFLNIVNIFMTVAVVYVLSLAMPDYRRVVLALIFWALGAVFLVLARREFAGERITRPVIF
jgi:ABC-type transport system involved in multi-copper enzyme maturation permease subunit